MLNLNTSPRLWIHHYFQIEISENIIILKKSWVLRGEKPFKLLVFCNRCLISELSQLNCTKVCCIKDMQTHAVPKLNSYYIILYIYIYIILLFSWFIGLVMLYSRFQDRREPAVTGALLTDDWCIVSTSQRIPHLTGVNVQQEQRRVRGVAVSKWIVRGRLREANLAPKRPGRLAIESTLIGTSNNGGLSCSLTSVECVCMAVTGELVCTYSRLGEWFAQCTFAETFAYGGGSCMMWAEISLRWRID